MRKINRRFMLLILIALSVVVVVTTLYYLGMTYLEHRPRTLLQSLEFVVQTMTTVGYGQDAGWESPWMYVLVIITQLAGIGIVFLSIPIVLNPWLQERLALRPPREYTGPGDHVILTEYTRLMDSLIDLLEEREVPYVLIDEREDVDARLHRDQHRVMVGDPDDRDTLLRAKVDRARLVILNGPDQHSAAVSLQLQEFHDNLRIVALAGKTDRAIHLSSAGVDKVFYPRRVIGDALAHKALSALGRSVERDAELSKQLTLEEFPVLKSSPLIGNSLREARIRSRAGAHVVGIWREGTFHNAPQPGFTLRAQDILVAAGTPEQINRLSELTESSTRRIKQLRERVVIVGFGNEGQAARQTLLEHNVECFVINDEDRSGVDLVGNGMDMEVLQQAGVESSSTMLVTVSDDETATMVTLIARRLNPDMEILVQIHESSASEALYRAGASYVFSLDQISSRMLAGEVLGEDLLNYQLNIKLRRCGVGRLQGKTLAEENVGQKHRISIVAVERDGALITDLPGDFRFQPDDEVVVVGSDENVDSFASMYVSEETSSSS